jgi:hypothetical protein
MHSEEVGLQVEGTQQSHRTILSPRLLVGQYKKLTPAKTPSTSANVKWVFSRHM